MGKKPYIVVSQLVIFDIEGRQLLQTVTFIFLDCIGFSSYIVV